MSNPDPSTQNESARRVDLPISGMTCAACAALIEKVLNRLPGVQASVNLASERARVELAPDTTSPKQVVASIEKAGFSVPQQTLELAIEGMTCAACSTRLEKVLNRLPGVEAAVNLAAERARIRYVPGIAEPAALIAAVDKAGFRARLATDTSREEEKAKKLAAYRAIEARDFPNGKQLTREARIQHLILQIIDIEAQCIFHIHQCHLRLHEPGIHTGNRKSRDNTDQQPALEYLRQPMRSDCGPLLFLAQMRNKPHRHQQTKTAAGCQRNQKILRNGIRLQKAHHMDVQQHKNHHMAYRDQKTGRQTIPGRWFFIVE